MAAALVTPRSAFAAESCGEKVIQDWSDGTISGVYPIRCYRQALHEMPEDVRLYSSATEDIGRALTSRIRSTRRLAATPSRTALSSRAPVASAAAPAAAPADGARRTSAPLILGGALAGLLAVLAAGGFGARRVVRSKRSARRLDLSGRTR